ncbi:MAG TPA: hypothetical protein VMR86_17845, partial [Myxococcota bacterium]|nr:hypothetical protein [Myxococcota bacterium]
MLQRLGERIAHLRARWVVYGLIVGLFSGLAAAGFFAALECATRFTAVTLVRQLPPEPPPGDAFLAPPTAPEGPPRRWLFFLMPALG